MAEEFRYFLIRRDVEYNDECERIGELPVMVEDLLLAELLAHTKAYLLGCGLCSFFSLMRFRFRGDASDVALSI